MSLQVAGCGGTPASTADEISESAATTLALVDTVIIDVRAPEEFAEGHVSGAINLPLEDGTLEASLGTLDPSKPHLVYCRSGRRSALAVDLMTSRGFTDLTDLGGLEEAVAATGLSLTEG
jgi:phage shock protein E